MKVNMKNVFIETPFFSTLRERIDLSGGLMNAHLHIDRSGTLHVEKTKDSGSIVSDLSLNAKHALIPAIHNSEEYEINHLKKRVAYYLELMIALGTTRADTFVDVTDDRVQCSALEALGDLKSKAINFNLGAYSPLGFKDNEPGRWNIIEKGAEKADFIGSLPERDSKRDYPENIGFYEHVLRFLDLSKRLKKPLHIHVDQRNDPRENGTELVIDAIEKFNYPVNTNEEPMIWLVHVISPSTYEEDRFNKLLEKIRGLNLGVICCPSAAISMRQLSPIKTPVFNSIARVLEMLANNIPVRLGSDNICDITSPFGTADLMDEIFLLANALRFYDISILAKLGSGHQLSADEIDLVRDHLKKDRLEIKRSVENYFPDPSY